MDQRTIAYLTFLVRLYRELRRLGIYDMADLSRMKPLPPLTGVSGLGNIFRDAAKAIEEVKSSGTSLGSEASALISDINTVREHVRREHEDFRFKVSTLGNGAGSGESEMPPPPPTAKPEQPESPPPSETQEVGPADVGSLSFRSDTDQSASTSG